MILKLSAPFLLAAFAVAGCATQSARSTAPGDVCTDTRDVDMGVFGSASSRTYNTGCAARLARNTLMQSKDPGVRAIAIASAAEAGDINPDTLARVSKQLQEGQTMECRVTAVSHGQAALACPAVVMAGHAPR